MTVEVSGPSGASVPLPADAPAVGEALKVLTTGPLTTEWGGAGSLTLIERQVAGVGGVASFDFTAIPATFEDLLLVVMARGDTAAQAASVAVRFNNDSTAIYDNQVGAAVATTAAAAEGIAQTSIGLGSVPAGTATAGRAGHVLLTIPSYARSVFHKTLFADNGVIPSVTSGTLLARFITGLWRSSAAITRVTLLPSAGNFAEGSVATLYGRGPSPT